MKLSKRERMGMKLFPDGTFVPKMELSGGISEDACFSKKLSFLEKLPEPIRSVEIIKLVGEIVQDAACDLAKMVKSDQVVQLFVLSADLETKAARLSSQLTCQPLSCLPPN